MADAANILIVDDIEANRSLLSHLIVTLEHVPVLAENGRQALSIMEKQLPDIVLLDILMPEMDGYEVLKHMKESDVLKQIPVIMISAIDDMESVVKCVEMGADDYLAKPFNPTLLRARIGACLEKKRLHDRELELHAELSENYGALQKAEQARDALYHMIVHDLNNLLSVIMGNTQIMQCIVDDSSPDKEELAGCLRPMRSSCDEMTLLIMSILDVSKLEAGRMPVSLSPINVPEIVKKLYEQFTVYAKEKGKNLAIESGPDEIIANADGQLLSRVLQNLLTNALKHTAKGANVKITVKRDGGSIVFCVADEGPGIPEEYKDKIFDKFFQIDKGGQKKNYGSGLGLAFCKLAVEAQGGKIMVESTEGKGTEFIVTMRAL